MAWREGAPLLPSLDLAASTTRTEITDSAARGAGVGGRNDLGFGAAASWEIDLWGRVRATRDAARLDAEATGEELRAAAVTLSAEVARRWYELAEQEAQLTLLHNQVKGSEQVLELVTLRFRKGQVGAADVLRQRQFVESTRGERAPVAARIEVLKHQLAVLIGQPPEAPLPGKNPELRPLPPLPQTGVPADLLARRPDVRQALRNLAAADRRVAASVADRLPRLALTGSASFSAEDLREVLDNWLATMTVNLVAPLVDGGRRRAEVARTEAVTSRRIREYGSAVLLAFREVEDALVQESAQREQIESLDIQLEISAQALERLRDQYLYGTATYLDVLQALLTHQTLERSRVSAALALVGFRIDLYRALAGGFELERPKSESWDGALAALDPSGETAHP